MHCVVFIFNLFMCVDISSIAEQISGMFSVDGGHIKIKIITLQNDLYLKFYLYGCTKLLVSC